MRITMLIAAALLPAAADGPERAPPVTHEPTLQECGECHMAFQPALLPAESWRRIMTGLSDHFGEDARERKRTPDSFYPHYLFHD